MTQQDFWQDEKLWAEPAGANLSLKDQWQQAVGKLAAYLDRSGLDGLEEPSELAEAWMKRSVNNLLTFNAGKNKPPSFFIHMVAVDVAESKDMGRTMNTYDVLPLKTKVTL